jgi:hypothetical protein
MMKVDEQKERRDKWREIIDEYLTSNMTQKSFCEKHNLSIPQLVYYHGQFKREKQPLAVKPTFVPVKIPRSEKPVAASEIKLSLPNGFQCAFPSDTDAVHIKRLVEILLSC